MKRRHTQQLLRSTYINTYAIFPALRQHAIQRTYHTQQEHMTYTHCLRSMLRRGVRYWAGRVRRRRHHEVCEHQCARYATNSLLSLVLRRLQSRVQNKRRQLVVFEVGSAGCCVVYGTILGIYRVCSIPCSIYVLYTYVCSMLYIPHSHIPPTYPTMYLDHYETPNTKASSDTNHHFPYSVASS
ncbi:hypothetical protein EON65_31400 [archaeon]|nr:MAG: hypothetical protein EON65_31400 [archaeon]